MAIKAVLWDVDGVLNSPEEFFSVLYAKSRDMDPQILEPFFKGEFRLTTAGKADLKEILEKNRDLWQWQGSVEELMEMWFKSEHARNEPLLKFVKDLRQEGVLCFLATNQEKYRGQYVRNKMFPGEFDGYFVSADMGVEKPNPAFFTHVLAKLNLPPENIAYFDDTPEHIEAAKKLGIKAHLYQSLDHSKQVIGK